VNIYLAAPLFTVAERQYNLGLCKALERESTVYLPQRDGILLADFDDGDPAATSRVAAEIFERDVSAIVASDIIVAVLDGPSVDEGVAFEMGLAVASSLTCLGITSDSRRLGRGYFRNPMWAGCLAHMAATESELLDHVRRIQG
jgi:nucleoside 2-deoxyribosyltransferase